MIEPSEKVRLFLDVMRDGTDEQVLEWRMCEAEAFSAELRGPAPGGGSPQERVIPDEFDAYPLEPHTGLQEVLGVHSLAELADACQRIVNHGEEGTADLWGSSVMNTAAGVFRFLAVGVARPGEDAPPDARDGWMQRSPTCPCGNGLSVCRDCAVGDHEAAANRPASICLACGDSGSNYPSPNQPEPCYQCGGNPEKALHDAFFVAMSEWKSGNTSVALVTRGLALRGTPPSRTPDAVPSEGPMRELLDAAKEMYEKLDAGTLHSIYCNGNHDARVGAAGLICNCTLGQEIKSLRKRAEKAESELAASRAHSFGGCSLLGVGPPATPADWVAAVRCWQDDATIHPLTCGNDSSHPLLRAIVRNGRAALACSECGYLQEHIPSIVLDHYQFRQK